MEILGIVGISGPVFYIIGLVVFIRWIVRGGRSAEKAAQMKVAEQLRQDAAAASPEVAHVLLDSAYRLDGKFVLGPPITAPPAASPAASTPAASTAPASAVTGWHEPDPSEAAQAPAVTPAFGAPGQPASATHAGMNVEIGDVMKSLDNINVLLYLGAFLIVVSAGIFVGYNFSVLSGGFKTMFLALFAGIFYAVGLVLFLNFRKLRPAGVTFTGIGLVLLPLVGLAAYNFTSLHDHRAATWFVTSVFTLIAYIITLAITRQTYIAYLMAFTTLSVFESSISLFSLPVYWFGWAMATVSILLLSIPWGKFMWEDAESSLQVSANVFLPVSLILSLVAVEPSGTAQMGVTLALAGIFYALMARRNEHVTAGEGYWVIALFSLPAAITVGLWDTVGHLTLAWVLVGVAAAYMVGIFTVGNRLNERWLVLWAVVAGILPFGGMFLAFNHPWAVAACLGAAAVVNAVLAFKLRQTALAMLAALGLIALPAVIVRLCLDPAWPWSVAAVAEFAVAGVLVAWARRIKDWPESGAVVGIAGYLLALTMAVVFAAISSATALFWVSLAVAVTLYGLSYTEHRTEFVYVAASALYIAVFQPAGIMGWDVSATALFMLLSGFALYALGAVETDADRAAPLRYAGLAGPFVGAMAGASLGGFSSTRSIVPALALAGGACLLYLEAKHQEQAELTREVAGGILILSLNWACGILEVDQTQMYTVPWAAYAAYLGYKRRDRGHTAYDGFTVAALGLLTVPLAGQALASDGQGYGLLLILEAIALVFAGMGLRYKLVTIWGAATLVVEVLYQMRDFFYALPKYFISAALGLALLAVAIVMLQRRKGGD